MTPKTFIDSSAWIAYYFSDEPGHIRIKNIIKNFAKENFVIATSNDVIDETVTLLIYAKPKLAARFIEFIKKNISANTIVQLWVDEEVQNDALALAQKFSEHKLSLTDCTSITLIKKYNIESVVSLDSDFIKVGISTLP